MAVEQTPDFDERNAVFAEDVYFTRKNQKKPSNDMLYLRSLSRGTGVVGEHRLSSGNASKPIGHASPAGVSSDASTAVSGSERNAETKSSRQKIPLLTSPTRD